MRTLLYLPEGDHPAHAAIMKQAGAHRISGPGPGDLRRPWRLLSGLRALRRALKEHGPSMVVAESFTCGLLLAGLRRLHLLPRRVRITALASDPGAYFLRVGRLRSGSGALVGRVDHFFAVSEMCVDLLRESGVQADRISRIRITMSPERFRDLANVTPALERREAVFVGHVADAWCKGIDLLADAWAIVHERKPDARLRVVGKLPGVDETLHARLHDAGVECPGPTNDIVRVLGESSLYVHVARGDAFPIAVLEAMRAGLPAIVSDATGSKELVRQVEPAHVTPLDPQAVAEAILRYFEQDTAPKRALSEASRRITAAWDPADAVARSAEAVRKVAGR